MVDLNVSVNKKVSQEDGSIHLKISCTKLNNNDKSCSDEFREGKARRKSWETKIVLRKELAGVEQYNQCLVTVSTSPMILEVGSVETHFFKLHFHAC